MNSLGGAKECLELLSSLIAKSVHVSSALSLPHQTMGLGMWTPGVYFVDWIGDHLSNGDSEGVCGEYALESDQSLYKTASMNTYSTRYLYA